MSHCIVLVVAAAAVATSAPAAAQPATRPSATVITIRVPYRDLDLTHQAGADALIRRVAQAAARACRDAPPVGAMAAEQARAFRACKIGLVGQAMAQVDAPLVQQRYAERTGGRPIEVAAARR